MKLRGWPGEIGYFVIAYFPYLASIALVFMRPTWWSRTTAVVALLGLIISIILRTRRWNGWAMKVHWEAGENIYWISYVISIAGSWILLVSRIQGFPLWAVIIAKILAFIGGPAITVLIVLMLLGSLTSLDRW